MRRRIQRIGALVLMGLVLSAGVLPDVVFCSDDNGHRAFELATRDCCHADSVGHDDCESREDHCATDCNDIRFSANEIVSKLSGSDLGPDATRHPLVFDVDRFMVFVSPIASFHPYCAAPYDPAPRQRHTTVQLC